jgi:hypothetical protein
MSIFGGTPVRHRRTVVLLSLLTVAATVPPGLAVRARAADRPGAWAPPGLVPRTPAPKPGPAERAAVDPATRVVRVKFREGSGVRTHGGVLRAAPGVDLAPLEDVVAGIAVGPLLDQPEHEIDAVRSRVERVSGEQQADMNLYARLTLPAGTDARRVLDGLNALDIVEAAFAESRTTPTASRARDQAAPATPDLTGRQAYREDGGNGFGFDAVASVPGIRGEGIRVVDIENGWNVDHEDLGRLRAPGVLVPGSHTVRSGGETQHGAATIGILAADDNGFGVTGLVTDADIGISTTRDPATDEFLLDRSLARAVATLEAGDVILLETSIGGRPEPGSSVVGDLVPVELDRAVYDQIVLATSLGIHVVEAAANGGTDLDAPRYGTTFPDGRPDSGAIMVGGGGSGLPGCSPARVPLENFGRRVDVHGWAECVVTAGYGDLHGERSGNDAYTARYGGTSAGSALVAAAVAALAGAHRSATGRPVAPSVLRAHLVASGEPQDGPAAMRIGPRPDLARALDRPFGSAPALLAR